jgi:hypothetical protein
LEALSIDASPFSRLEAALRAHVHYVVRERFAAMIEPIRVRAEDWVLLSFPSSEWIDDVMGGWLNAMDWLSAFGGPTRIIARMRA